jgi:hypothetical protein
MPATEKAREAALEALAERRRNAKKSEDRVVNSSLYAGSAMYFYCIICGDEMSVPENYTTRPKKCAECRALEDCGWLE